MAVYRDPLSDRKLQSVTTKPSVGDCMSHSSVSIVLFLEDADTYMYFLRHNTACFESFWQIIAPSISTENSLNNGDKRRRTQRRNSRKSTGGKDKICVYHVPVNRSSTYITSHQWALPLGNERSPGVTRDHFNIKGVLYCLKTQ